MKQLSTLQEQALGVSDCPLFCMAVSLTRLQRFPHLQLIKPWYISDLGVIVAAICQ